MATNYPVSIDNFTNPSGTDKQSIVSHAGQHTNANDAILALQNKVGIDKSNVITSLDYAVTRGVDKLSLSPSSPSIDYLPSEDESTVLPSTNTTFSRASNATRVNKFGYIETMGTDEVRHQYNPTTGEYEGILIEEASTNLLVRSEDFTTSWMTTTNILEPNQPNSPDGLSKFTKVIKTSALNSLSSLRYPNINLTSSGAGKYCLSIFAKRGEGQGKGLRLRAVNFNVGSEKLCGFNLETAEVENSDGQIEDYGNGVYRCSLLFEIDGTDFLGNLYVYPAVNSISAYPGTTGSFNFLWGAQLEKLNSPTSYIKTEGSAVTRAADVLEAEFTHNLDFTRASGASRVAASGQIEQMSNNEIRHNFNPQTLDYEGVLLEEASTNKCLYSEQLDNAAHLLSKCTITANATTAPDGTTTADKIVENTANGTHLYRTNIVTKTGAAENWSGSIFVKAGERTKVWAYLTSGSTGQAVRVEVDLTTGAITNAAASGDFVLLSAQLESHPNEWYRIKLSGTTNGLTTLRWAIYPANDSNLITYTGDGTSGLFVWGMQIEKTDLSTSYIKTEATEVTRAADVFGRDFDGLIDYDKGTLIVSGKNIDIDFGGLKINHNYTNVIVDFDGIDSTEAYNETSAVAFNQFNNVGVSYKDGVQLASINGSSLPSNDSLHTNYGMINLTINSGILSRISYIPRPLDQSNLNLLTK